MELVKNRRTARQAKVVTMLLIPRVGHKWKMPYEEDGESWDLDYKQHIDGMAENRPGHKKFDAYRLPKWVKHPLSHPFSGIAVTPEAYAYACLNGTLDGLTNFLGWGPAHIACMYGNMDMLKACTEQELNAQTFNGETPAWYSVRYGTPWCLQWLVEHGKEAKELDTTSSTPVCAKLDCSKFLRSKMQQDAASACECRAFVSAATGIQQSCSMLIMLLWLKNSML
eukprot:Skav222272  [mRNA]  locus=scaffold807:14087:24587:+ [translate_table: standard]